MRYGHPQRGKRRQRTPHVSLLSLSQRTLPKQRQSPTISQCSTLPHETELHDNFHLHLMRLVGSDWAPWRLFSRSALLSARVDSAEAAPIRVMIFLAWLERGYVVIGLLRI